MEQNVSYNGIAWKETWSMWDKVEQHAFYDSARLSATLNALRECSKRSGNVVSEGEMEGSGVGQNRAQRGP